MHPPTEEQAIALDHYGTGSDLIIQAGAGTGKTTTLEMLARSNVRRRGQYLSFNKAIAMEAERRMPDNVSANTAHSVAMRAFGRQFAHRLNTPRMSSSAVAEVLGIQPIGVQYNGKTKMLQRGYLAGLAQRAVTNFCQSDRLEPSVRDVPYIDGIDQPDGKGRKTYANNNIVAQHILKAVKACWQDSLRKNGKLRYTHDRYLKAWQLAGPRIDCDFLMFDEAQDVSPVLAAIAAYQADHAQLIYVGDGNQAIYEWLGAVDAMDQLTGANEAFLTQSFRFGQPIADVANELLLELGSDLRLRGFDRITSVVGPVERPDCILTRSNAKGVEIVLNAMMAGRKPHLVGGAKDVLRFAEAAQKLKAGQWTPHEELTCFSTWGEVQDYVANDILGDELKLMVTLIDKFTPEAIIAGLSRMATEAKAEYIVSTAHKAKGREWGEVQLAGDFPGPGEEGGYSDPELRLMYVAATRGQNAVDLTNVPFFAPSEEPAVVIEAAV